jgi:hypothetical protein
MHVHDGIRAARWWTLDELDATADSVWPERLADLIRGLLALLRDVHLMPVRVAVGA